MKYVVLIIWVISADVTLQGGVDQHEREVHDQSVTSEHVGRHAGATSEMLRTASELEQPLLINIEQRPCGDAHQICTGITIQQPSSELPLSAPSHQVHLQPQSAHGVPEVPSSVVMPVATPRESTHATDSQSYLHSWLQREVWLPALINGIAYYYGLRYLDDNNKQLLRLSIAAMAIPAWYTVSRTQRMEHGMPSFITGLLGMHFAFAAASDD